ncbi:ABC transporter ATP-binding protein [Hydrogenophaga flava]|uniref:ABC transporter ATP-binding protein n=1 Tax=Hydrogenophaga flava TaxID=65657 RepID=UPI00082663BD|nr:ABC transporter ATP-binding protein [Hydrogenophaga flava]
MPDAVRLESVEKTFADGTRALRGVQLRFARRQLTTLLGPSGCGKSTLLRLVAGLEQPTAGRVFIGERDVTGTGPDQRPISMVFQNYALFPHLDVQGNVGYGLGLDSAAAARDPRVQTALEQVGLGALAGRGTASLSGGQQQRVALARALALAPEVLLLDEPLSNLDAGLRRQIREEIRGLQQALGLTVVYVTHDQNEAMAVSDHIVVLRDGQVQQVGSPRDIYERPRSEFVAGFMGDAAVFDAEADGQGGLRVGPLTVNTGHARRRGATRVVVRPEAWRLAPASGQGLAGRIESHAYEGRQSHYRVRTALGLLQVHRQHERQTLQVGAPVSVFLDGPGVSVLLAGAAAMPEGP